MLRKTHLVVALAGACFEATTGRHGLVMIPIYANKGVETSQYIKSMRARKSRRRAQEMDGTATVAGITV